MDHPSIDRPDGANSAPARIQESAVVRCNTPLAPDVLRMELKAPGVAERARPGQFVHVRIPDLPHRLLRRPFSICDARPETGSITLVYKIVGEGTRALSRAAEGTEVDMIGPLGKGFSIPPDDLPVIVAGGYGAAATYLLARLSPRRPIVLIGGRSRTDLLLVREYRDLGCEVRTSTEDGSGGRRGLVTDLLNELLRDPRIREQEVKIFACGPTPMLAATAAIAREHGLYAEVSLDERMCCGVGACFTCVARVRTGRGGGNDWEYVRTCLEGPVFPADRIVWD